MIFGPASGPGPPSTEFRCRIYISNNFITAIFTTNSSGYGIVPTDHEGNTTGMVALYKGGLIFYIFNMRTPVVCCIPFKSKENERKNYFDPVTASSLVPTFWVNNYIRVKKIFHNVDFIRNKRRRILRRFQKYKLTSVTKCT
jgi:hypothetical protein